MGMSKDRCPYNSFFGEKVMIKEKLSLLWGKFVNRETISYLIFGVLTTLVDWISYAVFRHNGMNYRMASDLLSGGGDPVCICDKQDLGISKLQFSPVISS